MSISFRLADQPVERRARAWRDFVCGRFIELECDNVGAADVTARIDGWDRGCVTLSLVTGGPHRVIRTESAARRETRRFAFLNLQLAGRCLASQRGREVLLEPGRWAVFESSAAYRLDFDRPFRQLVLHLPADRLGGVEKLIEPLVARDASASALQPMVVQLATALGHRIGMLDPAEAEVAMRALFSMAAGALTGGAPNPVESTARLDAWLREHACDPGLTPGLVARGLGVPLRTVQSQCRRQNVTLRGLIWQHRLERAAALLSSPEGSGRRIGEVALECGFESFAHFSTRFRAAHGVSPRQWRAGTRAAGR